VIVEADDDRHLRTNRSAYATQYLAFTILEVDRAHRPVQIQIDGVDGHCE